MTFNNQLIQVSRIGNEAQGFLEKERKYKWKHSIESEFIGSVITCFAINRIYFRRLVPSFHPRIPISHAKRLCDSFGPFYVEQWHVPLPTHTNHLTFASAASIFSGFISRRFDPVH